MGRVLRSGDPMAATTKTRFWSCDSVNQVILFKTRHREEASAGLGYSGAFVLGTKKVSPASIPEVGGYQLR